MKTLWICMLVCCVSLPAFGAISIQTNGTNRTVTLQYTNPINRVNTTLEDAAEWMYTYKKITQFLDGNDDVIPFDNLTNAQKLSVVDVAVKKILIQWAYRNRRYKRELEARETSENEDVLIEE